MYSLRSLLLAVLHIGAAVAAQPGSTAPVAAPLRRLHFGDINFLHTTDTHGWHAGHLLEPSFSADWGDYISFSIRLREKLEAEGKDLLLIDTGDRIEGNGLYDGDNPKGRHTFEIYNKQHIDIMCSGNHELYKKSSSENEYYHTAPAYHDAYIASNLDIYDEAQGSYVPLARRYRKFTTRVQGIRIMSFGFLFNFEGNYNNTVVTPVQTVIKQQWFQEAIRDTEIDLFVVIGHADVRSDEFAAVFQAIREVQPDTLIQFFGGHVHIRDYKKFDSRSYGLASGRYMETIGFQSISGISGSPARANAVEPRFSRRYIDNNLYSFYHHSGHRASTFHTSLGRKVTKMITSARSDLKLDTVYGCAPQDYWMFRVPYPSDNSVYSWINDQVFPDVVFNPRRANKARFIITNTGAVRFDVFKGAFTRDSTFIVSPFDSGLGYIRDLPYDVASKILPLLNSADHILEALSTDTKIRTWQLAPPEQWNMRKDEDLLNPQLESTVNYRVPTSILHRSFFEDDSILDDIAQNTQTSISVRESSDIRTLIKIDGTKECINEAIALIGSTFISTHKRPEFDTEESDKDQFALSSPDIETHARIPRNPRHRITPGYTTVDDAGTNGDDTIHSPIFFFNVPNVVQAYVNPDPSSKPEVIDLVFNDFITPYILFALKYLGAESNITDVEDYMPGETTTSLLTRWTSKHWSKNC